MSEVLKINSRPKLVDPFFFPKVNKKNNSIYLTVLVPISIIIAIVIILFMRYKDYYKEKEIESGVGDSPKSVEDNFGMSNLRMSSKNSDFLDDNIGNEEWNRLTMDPYVFNPDIIT